MQTYLRNADGSFTQATGVSNPFAGIDVGNTSKPTSADLNGDGRLDFVVGNEDGVLRTYLSNADGSFSQATGAADPFAGMTAGFVITPGLADLNGDGRLDLVAGDEDGTLRTYLRNADGSFTQATGASNPFAGIDVGRLSAPALGDLNGDGRLDLVVGDVDGTLRTYLRNADGTFSQAIGAADPFAGIDIGVLSTPALADLNGDGRLDLVVGNAEGTLQSYTAGAAGLGISVTVTPEDEAPVVTTRPGTIFFLENGVPVAIDDGLRLSHMESSNLTGTRVAIGAGFVATQDRLTFSDQNGITGSYNTATGVLSLSGTVSLATYEAALRSVRYENTSEAPETAPRKIAFTVDDGRVTSASVTRTVGIHPFNDAPIISGDGAIRVRQGGSTVLTLADLSASDVDSPVESLVYTVDAVQGGQMIVAGQAVSTFTQMQLAASAVGFRQDGSADGTASFTVTASDGHATSAPRTVTAAVDLPPTVTGLTLGANDGTLRAGESTTLTLGASEAMSVTGTPVLTLSSGGSAVYVSGSGTDKLVFRYTVQAGENTPDLAVTGLALAGGTIRNAAGQDLAALPAGGINPDGAVVVDTTEPTLSISADATQLRAGQSATITFSFSEAVTGFALSDVVLAGGTLRGFAGSGTTYTATFTPIPGIDDGVAWITSVPQVAQDAAGNGNQAPAQITLRYDTSPPVTPAVTLVDDTGARNDDGITANAAYRVTATHGSTLLYFAQATGGLGSTTAPDAPTVDGRHVVHIAAQDAAGNVSARRSFGFTLDTTAPVVAFTSPDGAAQSANRTISGTVTDANPGTLVSLYANGDTTAVATATVQADGRWSASVTLPEGTHTIVARHADLAGNAAMVAQTLVVDTTAPVTTVTSARFSAESGSSPSDFVTNVAAQTISGALSGPLGADERVQVSLDGGISWSTAAADTGGSAWSFAATLAPGISVLAARVVDAVGNVAAEVFSRSYVLDVTPPAVPIRPALDADSDTGVSSFDGITNVRRPVITGMADAGATVTLYGTEGSVLGTTLALGNGSWRITPTADLAQGTHALTARAVDLAGTAGIPSQALAVTIDTTAPALSVTSPTAAFFGTAQRIVGTVAEDAEIGATVTLRADRRDLGTAVVQADRTWSATVDLGGFGRHTVTASVTDLAGNTGQVAATFTAVAPPPPAPPPANPNAPVQSVGAGETQTLSAKTSGSLEKTGAGTLILTGTNTYTEPTTVQAGTLLVNGSIVSPTTVKTGGTLGGSGSTGTVAVEAGGALAPGNSPGILSTRDLSLAAGAALKQEIGGTASGQFDQLKVTGTVALSGANLDVSAFGGFASTRGDRFVIIDNDGTDAVSGSFAGLNEGAVLGFGARSLRISYQGGDGNDVTLTDTTGLAFQREAFGAVVTSAESGAGQVYGLYEALLIRAPDALGLSGFTTALENGASLTQVAGAILGSVEHGPAQTNAAAYVESLYANLLNRSADAAGLQSWTGQLAAGASQASVAVQIASSAEAKAVLAPAFANGVFVFDASEASVARLYYGLLDRAPDAGGLRGFSAFIETSGAGPAGEAARLGQVASTILTSQEYTSQHAGQSDAAFVFDLYQDALGRAPDAGGQAGYLNALANGTSRAQVALDITQSHEAQVHLLGVIQDGTLLVA